MGLIVDSSVLIGVERLEKDVARYVQGREDEEVFISVISASELLHGVHRAADDQAKARRLAFVERVLAALPVLGIDLPTARSHSQLWAYLAGRGKMIGVHDSWLAATCLAHGLRLATGNTQKFTRVPDLKVEEWG